MKSHVLLMMGQVASCFHIARSQSGKKIIIKHDQRQRLFSQYWPIESKAHMLVQSGVAKPRIIWANNKIIHQCQKQLPRLIVGEGGIAAPWNGKSCHVGVPTSMDVYKQK
jgi:hypothetical protein